MPSDPTGAATATIDLVRRASATLGNGRLLCIDGPGASGKSTLAAAVSGAWECGRTTVVHTDEMLEGWRGLPGLAESVTNLLAPLATGRPGRWRQWDWHGMRWAGTQEVAPCELLVLEGVGSWSPTIQHLVTALVWVEASTNTRRERAELRDGEAMRQEWEQWRRDESRLHARLGTRLRADLVVRTDAPVTRRQSGSGP